MRSFVLASAVLLAGAFVIGGPLAASGQQLKRENPKHVATCDGADLYAAYCRDCHGVSGRGTGPAARLLPAPVPDLTAIAYRHGEFDAGEVRLLVIDHRSHQQMPDWENILSYNYQHQRALQELAVRNLIRHLERMQVVTSR